MASPTISNDALFLTMLIDAWEDRDVATTDVDGAYLHADMDDYTLLKLEGKSVDIMCEVNMDYEIFFVWRTIKALFNDFFQLDDKIVFEGVHATTLSRKQNRMVLRAINVFKEKRCGKLKGRTVADGSV